MIRTEVVAESQLSRRDLSPYDAVVLCNIAQFTEAEVDGARRLPEAGRRGRRLRRRPGRAGELQPSALRRRQGTASRRDGPDVGDAAKKEASFGFNPLGFRHPIIGEFDGEADPVMAGLTGAKTWQFHKLKLPPRRRKAEVALAFDNGDPAVIEVPRYARDGDPGRDLGRRRLDHLAAASELSRRSWSRWSFEAASGRLAERNVPGRPAARPGAARDRDRGRGVTVVLPDGQSVPSKLQAAGGVSQLHFEDTELSGAYQVKVGPPLALESTFAANPEPGRERPRQARPRGAGRRRAGLELRLPDQLEGADQATRRRSAAAASCTGPCSMAC